MHNYCTQCGTAIDAQAKQKNRRWMWWLLAVILMFMLGFWLGRRLAPHAPACPNDGSGALHGGGGGGGGDGSPMKMSAGKPGGGGGGGSGDGDVNGGGGPAAGGAGSGSLSSGGGDGGPLDMNLSGGGGGGGKPLTGKGAGGGVDGDGMPDGGGGGKAKVGDGDPPPDMPTNAGDVDMLAGVMKMSKGGKLTVGIADDDTAAGDPRSKNLSARDLRYDKTGLPHYPDHLTGMASGINYPDAAHPESYGTGAGVGTTDPFDTVVAWYRQNLPGGWSSSSVGDLQRLGAQARMLNPANLLQMLNGQQDATAATDVPDTAAPDRVRLAIFNPPPNTPGQPGIMIVQKGDSPVQAFAKRLVP